MQKSSTKLVEKRQVKKLVIVKKPGSKKLKKCSERKKTERYQRSKLKIAGQKNREKKTSGRSINHARKKVPGHEKKTRSLKIVNNKSAEKMAKRKKKPAKQVKIKKRKNQNGSECIKNVDKKCDRAKNAEKVYKSAWEKTSEVSKKWQQKVQKCVCQKRRSTRSKRSQQKKQREKKKKPQREKNRRRQKCDRAKNAKESLRNREEKKTSEVSEKIRRRRKRKKWQQKYESASAKKMEVYKGAKTGTGKKNTISGTK